MAKKGKMVEIKIKDTMFPNKSIGIYEDKKVIFKGGIKGQTVLVKFKRKRKDYIEGKLLEVIENSPLEKNLTKYGEYDLGPCPYGTLLYEDELKLKEEQILNLFKRKYRWI